MWASAAACSPSGSTSRSDERGSPVSKKHDNYGWDKRRILVAAVAGGMALLLLVPIVMQIFILAV